MRLLNLPPEVFNKIVAQTLIKKNNVAVFVNEHNVKKQYLEEDGSIILDVRTGVKMYFREPMQKKPGQEMSLRTAKIGGMSVDSLRLNDALHHLREEGRKEGCHKFYREKFSQIQP